MTDLIKLLNKLCHDKQMDKYVIDEERGVDFYKDCETYFNEFKDIYEKIDRHLYSEISEYVEGFADDAADVLVSKLSCIIEYAKFNQLDETEACSYKHIFKLYDHIRLETKRSLRYRQMKQMLATFENEKKEANKMISTAEKTVNEAKEQTEKLSRELIAILGIFAGIIVTFSFSISTIGEALANLTNVDSYKMLFVVFSLGVVFVNAIAVLMCFVAKLAGFALQKKLPYIVYFTANVILITLAIICRFLMK